MNYVFIPESDWLQSAKITAQVEAVLDITGPLDLFQGPWIAGGAVRTWMEGGVLAIGQDVDVFTCSHGTISYNDVKKRNHGWYSTPGKKNSERIKLGSFNNLELVKQQYASVAHMFSHFPFTVCQFVTDGNTIVTTEQAIEDADGMLLHLPEPFAGIRNKEFFNKYLKKGFTPALGLMELFENAAESSEFSGENDPIPEGLFDEI